jgi:hypothetical protein
VSPRDAPFRLHRPSEGEVLQLVGGAAESRRIWQQSHVHIVVYSLKVTYLQLLADERDLLLKDGQAGGNRIVCRQASVNRPSEIRTSPSRTLNGRRVARRAPEARSLLAKPLPEESTRLAFPCGD